MNIFSFFKKKDSCEDFFKKDFKSLNHCIKGEKNYLFLINDTNNELNQHYSPYYKNNFKPSKFKKDFFNKKEYLNNKGIKYFTFIVPDKSIVCENLLPFKAKKNKRNLNLLKDIIPDFSHKLDYKCYFDNDSHINHMGGKELSFNYLNHMTKIQRNYFNKTVDNQMVINKQKRVGDLLQDINWSYSEEEKAIYSKKEYFIFKNKYLTDIKENIPNKFRFNQKRETSYYKNEKALMKQKVLILRDSSTMFLYNFISTYFNEILMYYDHWKFNKKLIKWYNPDIVLEIRTERFLENYNIYTKK